MPKGIDFTTAATEIRKHFPSEVSTFHTLMASADYLSFLWTDVSFCQKDLASFYLMRIYYFLKYLRF